MYRLPRYTMFVVTVLLALAMSAMWTVPVFADDEIPPPPETSEPAPPVEEGSAGEVVPVETPLVETPVDETAPVESPVVDAPAEEDAVVEETATVESAAAETTILEQLPEGTELIVVDEDGEVIPLATLEAADAVEFRDPIWCPTGVAPNPANPQCSTNGTSLYDLVNNVPGQPFTNGVIWIQWGDDAGANVLINDLGGWAGSEIYSLTLQGGWEGTYGSTALHAADPYSYFDTTISIQNWIGAVTIKNIVIDSAGGAGYALDVETQGNITLTDVKVTDNTTSLGGANLNNTSGAGNVTITNGEFSGNDGTGLNVDSKGTITLTNVDASVNGDLGADLANDTAPTPKAVSITNSTFNYNALTNNDFLAQLGLKVYSSGAITLKDVTSVGNWNGDADVDDGGAWLDNRAGTAGVTLLGTNVFSENEWGLGIWSRGNITVNNLVANSNTDGSGAYIDNCLWNGASCDGFGNVTFTGSTQAKFNNRGLRILSKGNITLNNVTATYNDAVCPECGGIILNNDFPGSVGNVTLTGTNILNDNADSGAQIYSNGSITLNNVTANGNGFAGPEGFGAYLDNSSAATPKPVTLTGTNTFNFNYEGGLWVESKGAITISNLTANDTQGGLGAFLNNTNGPPTSPQNVTLTGPVNVSNNYASGMNIWSWGAISLGNITANDNGWSAVFGGGVYLDNCSFDVAACLAITPKPITVTGVNNFNNNFRYGLITNSMGAITLNNITANDNGRQGLYADNSFSGAVGGVTLNGTSAFGNNGLSGLEIYSKGNILLKDLDAWGNGGYGGYLVNDYPGSAGNVTVGTNRANWCNGFGNNFYSGLEVYTNGTVILSNLCNNGNGGNNGIDPPYGYGLYVDNTGAATPKAVTLNGTNSFDANYLGGVYLYSDGAITASKLTANGNATGTGAFFNNNSNPLAPQNVTLNGYGSFYGNAGRGLDIATYGIVTLNSINADSNGSDGIWVDNYTGATLVKGVTINGYAEGFSNDGYGLFIHTLGAIRVNNLDTWGNGSTGALLDNFETGAVGGVTITGHAWASSNAISGLDVTSLGTISIVNLSAWGNGVSGAYIDNAWFGSVGTVTITGYASAGNNGADGLLVYSNRAITLNNIYTDTNGGAGAILSNTYSGSGSPQNVTVNGTNGFYWNGDSGLVIFTYGTITLNNITANDNGQNAAADTGWGAYLDNCGYDSFLGDCTDAVTPKGITLNGTNTFNGNFQDGLWATSLGLIKGNNLTANLNGEHGAYLDNQWGAGSVGGITLTGTNNFEGNGSDGLLALSHGTITMSNISANWNLGNGAFIDNWSITGPQVNVTLTGTNNFLGNGDSIAFTGSGLIVWTEGNITINNLTANWNQEDGAYLNNWNYAFLTPFVKLTGVNTFRGNGDWGLYVDSAGAVDLTKVTADANGDGVYVGADGNIIITCGSMTNNTGFGWSIGSLGTVTLKGVFAYGNGTNEDPWNGTFTRFRACPLP